MHFVAAPAARNSGKKKSRVASEFQRIAFMKLEQRLNSATSAKTLAVGCPFCKSMLGSTPGKSDADGIAIKDVAELLLESVQKKMGITVEIAPMQGQAVQHGAAAVAIESDVAPTSDAPSAIDSRMANVAANLEPARTEPMHAQPVPEPAEKVERKKWRPAGKAPVASAEPSQLASGEPSEVPRI